MRAIFLTLCLALVATPAAAQGFAGLGLPADGFTQPRPDHEFVFPADHGPHPDFRIEWWYVTANLTGDDGREYGVQWTLFRSALAPEQGTGWSASQLWMGHAALTTPDAHFYDERLGRGGTGQTGVTVTPLLAWIDDWRMEATEPDAGLANLELSASSGEFNYLLSLKAEGPIVAHGQGGYSQKSADGQASYYYSQPAYSIAGQLQFADRTVSVTGSGWLDHEWSSQPLSENQSGWDWVSLHFNSGEKLMGFRLRETDGGSYTSATWISADGQPTVYPNGDLIMTPLRRERIAGRDLPLRWRVQIPKRGIDIDLDALNPNSWMETRFPYWEGPVTISGSRTGRGYLEMTGY